MLDEEDLVSVIIPTYNRQDLLFEAIESVLNQVYVNFELLVIDNNSDDQTLERLDQINDTRIRVLKEPLRGAAHARNTGIRHAKGNFLAFLDSDDLWVPSKLALQVTKINELGKGNMLFAEYCEFAVDKEIDASQRTDLKVSLSLITMLIGKEDFNRVGLFDPKLQAGEFLEWYARAVDLGMTTSTIEEVLSLRRIHGGNSASGARSAKDYLNACRALIANRSQR
jgi:glycosyltransferase involved in cell wall biosynthesis